MVKNNAIKRPDFNISSWFTDIMSKVVPERAGVYEFKRLIGKSLIPPPPPSVKIPC